MGTDYDTARNALRDAEFALVQQREAVAALRRDLPAGPVAADYVFGAQHGQVRLDELVRDRPLVVYHFMFGGAMKAPCPMCSLWADGWNSLTDHLEQNIDFVLVTNGSVEANTELASQRGWQNLRWLSAQDGTFKSDFGSADADGNQLPVVTVFERVDNTVRLSYSGSAIFDADHGRGLDLLSPFWHLLDLTRVGRGDFVPQLAYNQ